MSLRNLLLAGSTAALLLVAWAGTSRAAAPVPAPPASRPAADLAQAKALFASLLGKGTLADADKERVGKLIDRLGADAFEEREGAEKALLKEPLASLPLLEKAASAGDAEVRDRAQRVIDTLKKGGGARPDQVIEAISVRAAAGDKQLVPDLLAFLDHPELGLRHVAEYALRRIAGQDLGYRAYADADKRKESIAKIKAWWEKNQATFAVKALPRQGILACVSADTDKRIVCFDDQGEEIWSRTPETKPLIALGLADGHLLVGFNETNGTAVEYDIEGKEVWSTAKFDLGTTGIVADVQVLENGNRLLAFPHDQTVIEINKDGKVIWQRKELKHCHAAQRLANGNTLVLEHLTDSVTEYKPKEGDDPAWSKADLTRPVDMQKLDNGNVLVAAFGMGKIVEVDAQGTIVWERKCQGPPSGVCRLANGLTVVSTMQEGTVLVGPDGEVIRRLVKHESLWGKVRVTPAGLVEKQKK